MSPTTKPKSLYLAGPMTGLPNFNHPAFNKAAGDLRDCGFGVLNPAEIDGGSTDKPWDFYMRHALRMLVDSDAVVVLDGWEASKGARAEVVIALSLGVQVHRYGFLGVFVSWAEWADAERKHGQLRQYEVAPSTKTGAGETILQEADRLVAVDRQATYGHPFDDFTRTGRIWAAVLGVSEVTPEQVALCMVGLKISRECHAPKRDNRVDGAGYFKCLDLVRERRESSTSGVAA